MPVAQTKGSRQQAAHHITEKWHGRLPAIAIVAFGSDESPSDVNAAAAAIGHILYTILAILIVLVRPAVSALPTMEWKKKLK